MLISSLDMQERDSPSEFRNNLSENYGKMSNSLHQDVEQICYHNIIGHGFVLWCYYTPIIVCEYVCMIVKPLEVRQRKHSFYPMFALVSLCGGSVLVSVCEQVFCSTAPQYFQRIRVVRILSPICACVCVCEYDIVYGCVILSVCVCSEN